MNFSQIQQRTATIMSCEPRLLKICLALTILNLLLFGVMNSFISPQIFSVERDLIQVQSQVRRIGSGDAPASASLLYQKAGEDLAKVYELIPDRTELSELILDVSKLASKAGFEISSVSYSPKKVEEFNLLSYSLSFKVAGNYRQLKKFIHLLEASPRIVILDRVSLVESKEAGVTMQVQITTYFKDGGADES